VSNLLEAADWECLSTPPGAVESPDGLPDVGWLPASVSGTVAGALAAAGRSDDLRASQLDAFDWWFRCRLPAEAGAAEPGAPGSDAPASDAADAEFVLRAEGLATLADVWVDGRHALTSRSMFVPAEAVVPRPRPATEVVIRFASLSAALAARAPRPRWKTKLVDAQTMRWFRTSLIGRMPGWGEAPAPVGPWRPVTLTPLASLASPALRDTRVTATCAGTGGVVTVSARLASSAAAEEATVTVRAPSGDEFTASVTVTPDGGIEARIALPSVERWWPNGYGDQPLYDVCVDWRGQQLAVGRVGFRDLAVDRSTDGFTVVVNGVAIFCRGACWAPVDPVALSVPAAAQCAAVDQAVAAGMTMLRIPGTMTYEDGAFWDACDERGVLVWQDVMCADMDYPDEPAFVDLFAAEVAHLCATIQGRPSVAVISGGSETEQQATMLGLPDGSRTYRLATEVLPALVERLLPGTPYVVSSPTGGPLAIRSDSGVAHYFGVGGYRRPLSDARMANVRFAAECLAVATPPEPQTVDRHFGGASALGSPAWRRGVPRDNGSTWDFEDVRDHYVRELFGVEPSDVRRSDPERALDLGRAAVCEMVTATIGEWRRASSSCAGALVLSLKDLRPGAGVGLVDSDGVPKAPYHAFSRVSAPRALVAVDEGLNGLRLHAHNDSRTPVDGLLRIVLYGPDGRPTEEATTPVLVPGRSSAEFDVEEVIGGFRDVNWSHRFGPPATDVVAATWTSLDGADIAGVVHFPLGPRRAREDIGLSAECLRIGGAWAVRIRSERAAQYVAIDAPGFVPARSWFHLAPGGVHEVPLDGPGDTVPRVVVRALNARVPVTASAPVA
jgi:beta-mannosidase